MYKTQEKRACADLYIGILAIVPMMAGLRCSKEQV